MKRRSSRSPPPTSEAGVRLLKLKSTNLGDGRWDGDGRRRSIPREPWVRRVGVRFDRHRFEEEASEVLDERSVGFGSSCVFRIVESESEGWKKK